MLSTNSRTVTRVRHELKLRPVTVQSVRRLSPHIVRVTFEGPTLSDFTSASFDDHVKLMLPPDASFAWPTQLSREVLMTSGVVMRDYTPRSFDGRTLDIELALHGEGPAASWASRAKPGDRAAIGGPKGSMIIPTAFAQHVLVGDESALPAIARRLEELPAGVRADAIVLVGDLDDRRALDSAARAHVTWVHNDAALLDAIEHVSLEDDAFVWAAGEAATMAQVRARFVSRVPKERMRVSAYWKRGERGHHERLDD